MTNKPVPKKGRFFRNYFFRSQINSMVLRQAPMNLEDWQLFLAKKTESIFP